MGAVRTRGPLLVTALLALVLAWILAPRPSSGLPDRPSRLSTTPPTAPFVISEARAALRPLVIGSGRRGGDHALPYAPARASHPPPPRPGSDTDEKRLGFLSGHVVDEQGYPVKHAVLHLHSTTGTLAQRVSEDGTFRLAVPEGRWTAEAGWFDGDDEWRSRPVTASVAAGENVWVPFEILMSGAAHGVHAKLEEAMGVGWRVKGDDGPLRRGDVLVEVDGQLLADLQPAAVKAALRSRPGETIPALVLRRGDDGDYQEVAVVLDAR